MRYLPLENIFLKVLFLAGVVGLPLNLALGHEGHHVECNETAINALKADIQAGLDDEAAGRVREWDFADFLRRARERNSR